MDDFKIESLGCAATNSYFEITKVVDGKHYVPIHLARYLLDHKEKELKKSQELNREMLAVIKRTPCECYSSRSASIWNECNRCKFLAKNKEAIDGSN